MDREKLIQFISNSFLLPLLQDENITDISYNGKNVYYLHNFSGRQKSDITIDENQAKDFIRQIANLSEKQFSYQNPKLDVSFDRYRINAVHPSIARHHNEKCLNFSIRIAGNRPIITNRSNFLNAELIALFDVFLRSKVSMVIGGITGSGKTEFQKYLISSLIENTRVIIIDNVLELDNLDLEDKIDINIWQSEEKNEEASIQELVRNALRSNPDWLIVAESRGKEMMEVLNSAMTGHPIITTIHALDIDSMPTRIGRMVMMNEQKQNFDILMQDIFHNFQIYIYLCRDIDKDGKVHRYIKEISEFDEKGNKHPIYLFNKGEIKVYKIRDKLLEKLTYSSNDKFIDTFVKQHE